MKTLLSRYATPFTTGLFLVSLISGIALFFHVGPSGFHGMHEILSMVLILPFLLHIWKNWRPFLNYFRRMPMAIALMVSVIASGYYLIPTGQQAAGGGNPMFSAIQAIENGSVANVAPLYGHDAESLTAALTEKGFTAATPEARLIDVATQSGKSERDIIITLNAIKK